MTYMDCEATANRPDPVTSGTDWHSFWHSAEPSYFFITHQKPLALCRALRYITHMHSPSAPRLGITGAGETRMAVTRIYHGGPLKTEHFGGHSLWTWKRLQATEYAENPHCSLEGDLWTTEIDLTTEVVADLDDYAPVDPETGYQDWDEETETAGIIAAVADGATVVLCEDGWVVVNVERLGPVRTTVADEEAREEQDQL